MTSITSTKTAMPCTRHWPNGPLVITPWQLHSAFIHHPLPTATHAASSKSILLCCPSCGSRHTACSTYCVDSTAVAAAHPTQQYRTAITHMASSTYRAPRTHAQRPYAVDAPAVSLRPPALLRVTVRVATPVCLAHAAASALPNWNIKCSVPSSAGVRAYSFQSC